MAHHDLKTWPEYLQRVISGQKTFEVRKNDRDYQVGDTISLYEYEKEQPTNGRPIEDCCERVTFIITYILHGGQLGIEHGYCIMQLMPKYPPPHIAHKSLKN